MLTKRERLAVWADKLGLSRVLSLVPQRSCLLVLNYHRIGDAAATHYDPGTFSATAEELDEQMQYLRAHVHVANLKEALDFSIGRPSWKGAAALITFDDGYRDNYRFAFPVLRAQKVQGVFFLPTSFTGTNRIPWWDRIAYLVRHTARPALEIDYPKPARFDLVDGDRLAVLEGLLRIYKSEDTDSVRFLDALETAAGVPSVEGERLFLNWDEAREMVRGGMAAGSHTHTHELLAKLSPDDQFQEVRRSRYILQEQLKIPVDTLAYPVGSRKSFSSATFAALARAGYRAAFSFYGGVNLADRTEPYNIRRIAVDAGQPRQLFRAKAALTTFTGKDIIR